MSNDSVHQDDFIERIRTGVYIRPRLVSDIKINDGFSYIADTKSGEVVYTHVKQGKINELNEVVLWREENDKA